MSKPPELSVADAIASRVPFPCTRISWTPSLAAASPPQDTIAYVPLPILNVSAPRAPLSVSKPPEPPAAESIGSSVPSSWMRISWTPLPRCDDQDTMA